MIETIQVTSPFSGKVLKEIPLQAEREVFDLLDKSYRLFINRDAWLDKVERIRILTGLVHKMTVQKKELAELAASEGGKPMIDSVIEVERAIQGVGIAIRVLQQQTGEIIPMGITPASKNRLAFTLKEPAGVVVAISAFNHPLNLIVHQVVPAVAAGAPVIVKPAKATPLSCLSLMDLLYASGLPEDWARTIVCHNWVTEKLIQDTKVRFLSFIGSAGVGWHLKSILPPGAGSVLEHGGVAPVIIEKDATIEDVVPALLKGGFYHAGQVCVSVQRVFVHESIVKEVLDQMVSGTEKLVVGDPLDTRTEVGPLIAHEEVDRVERWVQQADNGKNILCGGRRINACLFEPTIIFNPPEDCDISKKEVFGPVVAVYSYFSRREAIERANSLPFSFQASVFTRDLDVALDTVSRLKANTVMVNDHTAFRTDWMPFGGSENSGIGVGGIPYSIAEISKDKLVVIKSNAIK